MRIQRYIARDMRSALAQVREALGPDAVILSSGRIGNEVEVVAAIDMEVAQAVASAPPARSYAARAAESTPRAEPAQPADTRHAELIKQRRSSSQISESLAPTIAAAQAVQAPAPAAAAITVPGQEALASEMKDMRRMLESQLATLAWNDLSRRSPMQAAMQKELAQIGITQDLANSLVRKIPGELAFSAARRFALATIARTVRVTGDRWLEKGGVVAFAGPAGAGKTTLLAKLAARWVLRHGPRRVALVSADAVRIGAHEQMHMLGRLLGVTTHNVFDVAELPELLYELRGCQFIMIDTAGASPRDPELARRLRLLRQLSASIETALVLPASTQAGAIDEVIQRFELAQPSACVITKVDEAVSLGGVLSALVRHKLPAAYVSDGQRVPEDLSPARAHVLVSRAVEIASRNGATADDEVMQRRMTGAKHVRR
ncbi:MAG TPA: flagellar biosynthesis protein FlhF [Steroidobacteraceae bacterium]|nr:flagellar biosynthesis protein FlhF [Steroidobacteraceae bacterium]